MHPDGDYPVRDWSYHMAPEANLLVARRVSIHPPKSCKKGKRKGTPSKSMQKGAKIEISQKHIFSNYVLELNCFQFGITEISSLK